MPEFSGSQHAYTCLPGLEYSLVRAVDASCPRNDTASVAALSDGRLMIVWHKYLSNERGTSDFGTIEIASRTSADGGRTWGDERILVRPDLTEDLSVQAPALRRLESGDLLLMCLHSHRADGEGELGGSSSSMELFRSRDEGQTFQSVGYLWRRSPGQWLQGGASSLLQLASGRLLVPFHYGTGWQGSQHNRVSCMLSDDEGHTWRKAAADIDLPMRGAMEASVAELPDGELVLSLRTQLGAVFLSRSYDGGQHWSLPQTSGLRSPESCTCLRALPGTDDLILCWIDSPYDPTHHHFGVRTPLALALSQDRGQSWTRLGNVAHRDEFNFFDIGCDFVDDETAILTYGFYGPNDYENNLPDQEWHDPEVMDLHAVRLTKAWIYARLAEVQGG